MKHVNVGTYSFGMASPLNTAQRFQAAAKMGCWGIELLENDLALTDEELKAALDAAPIHLVSIHARKTDPEDFRAMLERLAPLGLKIAVIPGLDFLGREETLEAAGLLNTLGAIAREYGVKVCYHNHTSEFYPDETGKPLHEILIENTDPETVFIQLDVGWATATGVNVVEYLAKYAGRFASIHVKECSRVSGPSKPRSKNDPPMEFKPSPELFAKLREQTSVQCKMGAPESLVDWKAIDAEFDRQGADPLWIIEREYDYIEGNMLGCIQEDAAWLKANIVK